MSNHVGWHLPQYPPLRLEHLKVRTFRNLSRFDVVPAERFTIFSGANGTGKTSLLEAIYFAATSKSFRTAKAGELVQHNQAQAVVRATFYDGSSGVRRHQVGAVEQGRKVLRIDGNKPDSLGDYALRSPVVCFHLEELALSSGASGARRQLLDRTALFLDPSSMEQRGRYAVALRSRQRALTSRGAEARDLTAFEELCARHGAALTRARAAAAVALRADLEAVFRLLAPGHTLQASYAPGGSGDAEEARAELQRRRERDRLRGAASFGPQRDELVLLLDGHAVRQTASQGQHRAITLALKLAELGAIATARRVVPLLLLDDLSSELDRERTTALLRLLCGTPAQIFLTTTRPELVELPTGENAERREIDMGQEITPKDGENAENEVE